MDSSCARVAEGERWRALRLVWAHRDRAEGERGKRRRHAAPREEGESSADVMTLACAVGERGVESSVTSLRIEGERRKEERK